VSSITARNDAKVSVGAGAQWLIKRCFLDAAAPPTPLTNGGPRLKEDVDERPVTRGQRSTDRYVVYAVIGRLTARDTYRRQQLTNWPVGMINRTLPPLLQIDCCRRPPSTDHPDTPSSHWQSCFRRTGHLVTASTSVHFVRCYGTYIGLRAQLRLWPCWTSCLLCGWRSCLERSSCRCHFSTFFVHFPKTFKTASLSTLISWPCSLN